MPPNCTALSLCRHHATRSGAYCVLLLDLLAVIMLFAVLVVVGVLVPIG